MTLTLSADDAQALQLVALCMFGSIAVVAGTALAVMGWCAKDLPPNATWWQRFRRAVYEFL
jgi:hypothetical protein